MNITKETFAKPETALFLPGLVGQLQAIATGGDLSQNRLVLIGHPHSLHGGSMQNKVVTTVVRSCRQLQLPTLRFNFRGVGESEGAFDHGIGESDDVLSVIKMIRAVLPDLQIILIGFSFGAYVTYRVACQTACEQLVSIAPAVNHGNFCEFAHVPSPWTVIIAEQDEIIPQQEIIDWLGSVSPTPHQHTIHDASHFFHGKLVELKNYLLELLTV